MKTRYFVTLLAVLLAGCDDGGESARTRRQDEILLRIEQAAHRLKMESEAHEKLLQQAQADQEAIWDERKEYRRLIAKHHDIERENIKLKSEIETLSDILSHTQKGLQGPICAKIRLEVEKLRDRLPEGALSKDEQMELERAIQALRAAEKLPI